MAVWDPTRWVGVFFFSHPLLLWEQYADPMTFLTALR